MDEHVYVDRKCIPLNLITINTGLQVNLKPEVCTVGVQCSLTPAHASVQSVGIQCAVQMAPGRPPALVLPYSSSPLPSDASQSESETSQGGYETPDHDTSAFTLQDDTSS